MSNQWLFLTPSPLNPMKSDEPLIILVEKFSMEPAYCCGWRREKQRCKNDLDRVKKRNVWMNGVKKKYDELSYF